MIGLGKLGASMAAGMASRGLNVVGVDVSQRTVEAVNQGHAPVQETGLDEMIAANRARLRATTSTEVAIANSEISFVIVPTPSDERGAFTLKYVTYAFAEIGKALAKKSDYHVVVLTSTVLPGSTRYGLLPTLERESGKKCGADFGLCYGPEFIALGSVLHDFLNPDFYLIGEFDERSGAALEEVNRRVSMKEPVIQRMSLENAEVAKMALNSYVTMKISFANTLADLCERIPGGDVDVVTQAIGCDSRIGRKYLTGGMGFGGPCFPRDNIALAFIGTYLGANTDLLRANASYNDALARRFVEKLRALVKDATTVAVLGLAYKPKSHVVEESPGVYLAKAFADAGLRVLAYDPLARETGRVPLQYQALVVDSLQDCLKDADIVVVTTSDDQFRALEAKDFSQGEGRVTVVDFWRCLKPEIAQSARINYVPIGRCVDAEGAETRIKELWLPS